MKQFEGKRDAQDLQSVDSMLFRLCSAIRGAIDSLVLVESTLTDLHSALRSMEPSVEEAFDPVQSDEIPEPDPELELERRMAKLKQETCSEWELLQVSRKED